MAPGDDAVRRDDSAAPNFAYDSSRPEDRAEDRAGTDLSRWRVAVNGAEPIRRQTLLDFAEAFGGAGFQQTAFCPGYGLAELPEVSASRSGEPPVFLSVRNYR